MDENLAGAVAVCSVAAFGIARVCYGMLLDHKAKKKTRTVEFSRMELVIRSEFRRKEGLEDNKYYPILERAVCYLDSIKDGSWCHPHIDVEFIEDVYREIKDISPVDAMLDF